MTHIAVETDHGYNDHRIALQMSKVNWLQSLGVIEKETGSPGRTQSRAEAGVPEARKYRFSTVWIDAANTN